MYNQLDLFGDEKKVELDGKYTSKVKPILYEPKNKKPHVLELIETHKASKLIMEIKKSNIEQEEKDFLIKAAKRHNVFNYSKIADYYAHSSKGIQGLMEKSALVIVDFDKAIQYGYVKLSEEITSQYIEDSNDE